LLLAGSQKDLRQAEERHGAHEKRMLAEVDRARQSAKQREAGPAREQQQRLRSEEAAVQRLEAGRETQHAAQVIERELRDRLADQAGALAQAQAHVLALEQRADDRERQLGEEKSAHESTRALRANDLAAVRNTA
jgi:hypothetical protein